MFVKQLMIPKHACITMPQDATLHAVLAKLEEHDIDSLPVLEGERYTGTITRYMIYENFYKSSLPKQDFMTQTLAKDIQLNQDVYLGGSEVFEKTLFSLKDFPLLAVLGDNKKFLGIVTRFDVLEQFQSAFGMKKPGVRIAFTSVESEGRIARLADIAHQFHEHIISLVTFDETDKLLRRIVMKVEKNDNIDKFTKKLEKSGFRILDIQED